MTPIIIALNDYVTVALAATASGLTEKAIYRKIEDGKWIEGREYKYAPDGGIFISLKGVNKWVESGQGSRRVRQAYASSLSMKDNSSKKGLHKEASPSCLPQPI